MRDDISADVTSDDKKDQDKLIDSLKRELSLRNFFKLVRDSHRNKAECKALKKQNEALSQRVALLESLILKQKNDWFIYFTN